MHEKGRFEDVKLLITGYNDVNGSNGNNSNNMTLKEYVNQVGKIVVVGKDTFNDSCKIRTFPNS